MTTTTAKTLVPGHEPINGYVLEELIGRGGYGEVWRASAPGGMKKAIKFVYGRMGEKRTEQELKSLERIKGVQHPFILALERFESIDNQLVVVTELADGSLEDLMRQHRDRGSCGIPRATLLAYMSDVADALDYLHQLYKLQHLDIKPANLLMVGGRVKVADFGLLKDLQDIECSVVGGLTPIYAPPEVFDGKPSIHSDQYSMAVMYQELLTGTRPFTGRTIAQLATQHVHNAPNLLPLPPSDRPIVARALEKGFDRRYATCSEFVDALTRPRGSTKTTASGGGDIDSEDTKTVGASFVAGIGEANVKDLPKLESNHDRDPNVVTRNSLIIGIGGMAAQSIDELFCRVQTSEAAVVPTLHTVFLDTDEATARSIRRFSESEQLPSIHSLAVPLRSPNEYRDGGISSLRSMSRRWIYNIPRSGATEGMRPLGRLAMIDHWKRIKSSLQSAIESVIEASGQEIPGVYVIGSLAGGTGGGMYLDLVHVLRSMLDDAGLEQTSIISLLSTSSFDVDSTHPLAIHDTLASLREIQHFSNAGNSYPGDVYADLPSLPAARSPLRNIYLVADSGSVSAKKPYKTIADYLWLDATNGNDLLASARHSAVEESGLKGCLRSVGVELLSHHESFCETVLAPSATRTLLSRWLGDPANAAENAKTLVEKIQQRCGIDHTSFFNAAIGMYAPDRSSRQARLIAHLRSLPTNELSNTALVTNSLKAEFAEQVQSQQADSDIQPMVDTITRELKSNLRQGRIDIISAIETIRLLVRNIRQYEIKLQQQSKIGKPSEDLDATSVVDLGDVPIASMAMVKLACHVGEVLLESHSKRVAAAHADCLCSELARVEERLSDAATLLAQAVRSAGVLPSNTGNPWDTFGSPIARQVAPFLIDLHTSTAKPWLVNLIDGTEHIKSPAALVETINQIARPLVKERHEMESDLAVSQTLSGMSDSLDMSLSLTSISDSDAVNRPAGPHEAPNRNAAKPLPGIQLSLENVRPALLTCGGRQRLILVAGSQAELDAFRSEIQKHHNGNLTCIVLASATPMLIHEAQQISIEDVIARLGTLTGGQSQVSDRLLTRSDIAWSHRK